MCSLQHAFITQEGICVFLHKYVERELETFCSEAAKSHFASMNRKQCRYETSKDIEMIRKLGKMVDVVFNRKL